MNKKPSKRSFGGAIKEGAQLIGNMGKAFVRNASGQDTKALAKSWGSKKRVSKLKQAKRKK